MGGMKRSPAWLEDYQRKAASRVPIGPQWTDNVELLQTVELVECESSIKARTKYANLLVMFAERGIYPPVTEYVFAPPRKWRWDYCWPIKKVALEVDGGIWRKGGGAHSHPSNILRDIEKTNAAVMLGWRVIRATPDHLSEAVRQVEMLLGEAAA